MPDYGIKVDSNSELEELVKLIVKKVSKANGIGVIGMGKMGKNLSLNLSSKGFSVSVYNREIKGEEESIAADLSLIHI